MAQPPHVDKLPSAWGGAGEGVCGRRRIICLVALYDLPLEQLESYRPARDEPADFDAFWHVTLDQARSHAKPPVFAPTEVGLRSLETFDVTFSGAEGHPSQDGCWCRAIDLAHCRSSSSTSATEEAAVSHSTG